MADYLLAHGLPLSSVRARAQAAGTSHRMLLYYFVDKDEIVVSALELIGARLSIVLEDALPPDVTHRPDALLAELAPIMRGPALRPFMRLFIELIAFAARGEQPHRAVAGRFADGFLAWIASRLSLPDEAARLSAAARMVALLDGTVLLDTIGREAVADLALNGGA